MRGLRQQVPEECWGDVRWGGGERGWWGYPNLLAPPRSEHLQGDGPCRVRCIGWSEEPAPAAPPPLPSCSHGFSGSGALFSHSFVPAHTSDGH